MASLRFASLEGSIETFIKQQEKKKRKRDVAFLTEFLQTKGETRSEIAEIPPAELNDSIDNCVPFLNKHRIFLQYFNQSLSLL